MSVDADVLAPRAPAAPAQAAWRFWLPLAFQLLIVAAVPAPQLLAHLTGTTVLLRTAPVDPYDLLRGRYMRLGYADQDVGGLERLPGWKAAMAAEPRPEAVWVVFAPAPPGKPWTAVDVRRSRPEGLPGGQVAIRGDLRGGSVDWGMDQYYVPEGAGDGIEAAMRQAPADAILVEARVDARGTAVLEGLWIRGVRY